MATGNEIDQRLVDAARSEWCAEPPTRCPWIRAWALACGAGIESRLRTGVGAAESVRTARWGRVFAIEGEPT
jgi:hypothetical protein